MPTTFAAIQFIYLKKIGDLNNGNKEFSEKSAIAVVTDTLRRSVKDELKFIREKRRHYYRFKSICERRKHNENINDCCEEVNKDSDILNEDCLEPKILKIDVPSCIVVFLGSDSYRIQFKNKIKYFFNIL